MASKEPRKTPLAEIHEKLGGRMVNFADWYMPVQFTGVIEEHLWTRAHAGIFDISHMTEFMLTGPDCIPFLKHMMTNSVTIGDFQAQYQHMCYPSGCVVDDLYIYRESTEKVRIIANAQSYATDGKDYSWLKDHIGKYKVQIEDLSLKRARFAFQGPETLSLLNPITLDDLSKLKRFGWINTTIKSENGLIPIFCARTGYTGEDDWSPLLASFEISCDVEDAQKVWNTFLHTGAKPIGLGARDSLRLECCFALYGHEINENITSVEANLGWIVKEKPDAHFIGEEVLLRQKKESTSRISVGLNLEEKGVLRSGYKVFKNGSEIGFITSGTYAPSLGKTVALALIDAKYNKIGETLQVDIREKLKNAIVVPTPFYSRGKRV